MHILLLALSAFTTSPAVGEIFGDVRVGETYLTSTPIQLVCGEEKVSGKTDDAGSFRLTSKSGGKCVFSVTHEGTRASVDVVVFDKPARYRFLLEQKGGAWVLKRV